MSDFTSAIGAIGADSAGGGWVSADPSSSSGTSSGDFLSGLGSLFGGLTNGISNIVKATNTPSPRPVYALPQSVYTPSNVNPSLTSITSLIFSPLVLILLLVGGIILFKNTKK